MTLTVHIERLVLDGWALSGADAQRVRHALELALAEQFGGGAGSETDVSPALSPELRQGAALAKLSAGPLALPASGSPQEPAALGRAIAASVHAALTSPVGPGTTAPAPAAAPPPSPSTATGKAPS